jgi:hypothetical protein
MSTATLPAILIQFILSQPNKLTHIIPRLQISKDTLCYTDSYIKHQFKNELKFKSDEFKLM